MSWLPGNYSLNSIKDQFTNLAGELLNEIRDEKESNEEQDPLNSSPLNDGSSSTSKNSAQSRFESKIISDLKTQISSLENEKKDLISCLEQLDTDNQQNVERVVRYKDNLQVDLNRSKNDFDNLKREYDTLKEWSGTSENDSETAEKCEELIMMNTSLEQEVLILKKNWDSSKNDTHRLMGENKLLRVQIEENSKYLQDETISQEDYRKLESILKEYEKRVRNYEEELQEVQKSSLNSMEDKNAEAESLQNIVESSNKIISCKNVTINELEKENFDLQNRLQEKIKILQDVEQKVINLGEEIGDVQVLKKDKLMLEIELEAYKKNVNELNGRNEEQATKISSLEKQIENLQIVKNQLEKDNLEHEKSSQLVTENNKKLSDLQNTYLTLFKTIYNKCFNSLEEFDNFKEITSKSDLIINYLTDLKLNQSELQEKVSQLSEQNQKSLQEIEKLTRNSSTLKQEIVNKNIEFEEFELEYNELLKSNHLILAELNSLKTNNLLTISETNEDSMLQLESDLESANTKIKELEVILDCEKSRPQSNEPFEMLQKSFDEVNVENLDLQKSLDKSRLDCENLDYKCNEQKAQIEALQEDVLNKDKQKVYLEEENYTLVSKLQELGDGYQRLSNDLVDVRSHAVQDIKHLQEKLQNVKMVETSLKLQNDLLSKELADWKNSNIIEDLQQKFNNVSSQNDRISKNLTSLVEEKETIECEVIKLRQELENGQVKVFTSSNQNELKQSQEKCAVLEQQLGNLNSNREQLITALNAKHEESLKYYEDIQNLQKYLQTESEKSRNYELELAQLLTKHVSNEEVQLKTSEIERLTDQNDFLKDKCDKMTTTLMHDQSSARKQLADANEREQSSARELERLRQHLLEIEEMYTKELLVAEQKTSEMQSKVNEVEQREKNSSNVYTSVSIRANQQVETLQTQLQLVTNQRDDIRNKLSDNEDQINKQAAALTNLQLVLQQFQKDKEKDVHNETDRIRRQIAVEKTAQAELQKEINSVKQQLKESKEGLQAASRLSDQLEETNKNSFNMNNELVKLRAKLQDTEQKYADTINQPDAKVDKMLIRNLIMGFISSNNNLNKDQEQILKIIGTVLDFTQQDNDKLEMNRNVPSGWINSILHPAHPGQNMSQESLSLAFVKFLENESKPMKLPSLLESSKSTEKSSKASSDVKPSILNDMLLPTFNDYGQRSSSSILKDVLK